MVVSRYRTLEGYLGRKIAGCLVWCAYMCMLIGAALLPPEVVAEQVDAMGCQLSHLAGGYGPYDYRTTRDNRLRIVESHHFNVRVENLISGQSGSIGGDIGYTLHAFPNHHRALRAMMRLGERMKTPQPYGVRFTVECYFKRALHFAPDDTVARMLYATFLTKDNREADAAAQLERATYDAGDNPFTHYNIGLVYMDLKHFDKALRQAHSALALGFPRLDLQNALKQAGQWREPHADAMAPAPSDSLPKPGKD